MAINRSMDAYFGEFDHDISALDDDIEDGTVTERQMLRVVFNCMVSARNVIDVMIDQIRALQPPEAPSEVDRNSVGHEMESSSGDSISGDILENKD